MLIFLSADTTAVSKTASTVSPEARQATDAEKDQDSGSDYGGDWSEDEWNDAQVSRKTLSLPGELVTEGTGVGDEWIDEQLRDAPNSPPPGGGLTSLDSLERG